MAEQELAKKGGSVRITTPEMDQGKMAPKAHRLPKSQFAYVGAVSLLGWNFVLGTTTWLDCVAFPNQEFPFLCALFYSLAINFGQVLMIWKGEEYGFPSRYVVSTVFLTISLVGILLTAVLQGDVETRTILAYVMTFCMGLAGAVFQATAFGLVGALPPPLTVSMMTGQGLAGILAALTSPIPPSTSVVVIYYTVCGVLTLGAIPLYQGYLKSDPIASPKIASMTPSPLRNLNRQYSDASDGGELVMSVTESPLLGGQRPRMQVVKDALPMALTVFSTFCVTFTVFPGLVTKLRPDKDQFYSKVFGQVLIGIFQVFDVIGRFLPSWKGLVPTRMWVATLFAALRLAFIPLFMLSQRMEKGTFFANDVFRMLLMVVFALSNGYTSTISMMFGPAQKKFSEDEQQIVGFTMSLFLTMGLLVGSMLGLLTQIGLPPGGDTCD